MALIEFVDALKAFKATVKCKTGKEKLKSESMQCLKN